MKAIKNKLIAVLLMAVVLCISTVFIIKNVNAEESGYRTEQAVIFTEYQIEGYDADDYKVLNPSLENVTVRDDGTFVLMDLGVYNIYKSSKLIIKLNVSAREAESQFEELFDGNNIVSVNASADWSSVNEKARQGIEIASNGNSTYFYYKNIIDLNKLSKDDVVFSTFVEKSDRSTVNNLKISLIDVHDPKNILSFTYTPNKDWQESFTWINTYLTVQFNGYSLGLPNEGNVQTLREQGTVIMRTAFSLDSRVTAPMGIRYDAETKTVYDWTGKIQIIDLDDDNQLKGKTPFKGFTDNKVYLKVETTSVKSCLLIQDLNGCKTNELSKFDTSYDSVLKLKYDNAYVTGDVLNAGKVDVLYKIPVVDCSFMFDDSVTCDYSLRYYENGWKDISNVISNNAFTPDKKGYYSLKYVLNGNIIGRVEKTVYFEVLEQIGEIIIDAESTSQNLYSYYKVQEYIACGGTGKLHIDVSYDYNGQKVFPDENNEIFLNQKGSLNINILVTDFLGATQEKTVSVNVNPIPVVDVYSVPASYSSGQEYILSDFSAINYCFEETDPEYYMEKAIRVNGTLIGPDRKYTPENGVNSLEIEFIGGLGTEYETIAMYTVPVLDLSDSFNVCDYFAASGDLAMSLIDVGIFCSFESESIIELPTLMSEENLNLSFSLVEGFYNGCFNKIEIVLEDYKDAQKTFTATFSRFRGYNLNDTNSTKSRVSLTLNGGDDIDFPYKKALYDNYADIANTNYYKIDFRFNGYDKTITDNTGNVLYFIKRFDNGKVFNGFTDGLVKVKIKLYEVVKESAFIINSISNQNLTSFALEEGDMQGPQINLCGMIPTPKFGEKLIIPKAVANDFFCGAAAFTKAKITKPDGSSINLNVDSNTEIIIEQYGVYMIEYASEDSYGNFSKKSYTVKMTDAEAPSLALGENRNEYKVGEKLETVSYTAKDNVKVKSIQVYVRDFNGQIKYVSGEFVFNTIGSYEVLVKVTDTSGNFTTHSFTVVVNNGEE